MMQVRITPASFFIGARFLGEELLASPSQDVYIHRENSFPSIVRWLFVVRIDHIRSASEKPFRTSACVIS